MPPSTSFSALGGLLFLTLIAFLTHEVLPAGATGPELAVVATDVDEDPAGSTVNYEAVDSGRADGRGRAGPRHPDPRRPPGREATRVISCLLSAQPWTGAMDVLTDLHRTKLRVGVVGYRRPRTPTPRVVWSIGHRRSGEGTRLTTG